MLINTTNDKSVNIIQVLDNEYIQVIIELYKYRQQWVTVAWWTCVITAKSNILQVPSTH